MCFKERSDKPPDGLQKFHGVRAFLAYNGRWRIDTVEQIGSLWAD
jgi:hypothetical protein